MFRDCWMDPYGNIYIVPPFGHDDWAQDWLQDEFPMEGNTPIGYETWEERGFDSSFDRTLQKRGWIRFTTTLNRWSCEHTIDYEDRCPKPTQAQIDKMYEVTGFNYYDDNTYSKFFKYAE